MTLKDVSDLRLLEGLQLLREPKDSANLSEEIEILAE